MTNWLSGQSRREWLDRQDAKLQNALHYYAGPAAAPINALTGLAGAFSPGADMMDMRQSGQDLMQSRTPGQAAQNAGWIGASALGMALPGNTGAMKRAYHATWEPFQEYDWKRLGATTAENQAGDGKWAGNLAKIGPWASEKDIAAKIGAPVSLPVNISGKGKRFASLDAMEKAVRKAGGPESFRAKMIDAGFGHLSVKDEEFEGLSYIGLTPEAFKVAK